MAYLAAPNGTVIARRQGILLPQCSLTSGTSLCSQNTDPGSFVAGLGKDPVTGAINGGSHSPKDSYWSGFGSTPAVDNLAFARAQVLGGFYLTTPYTYPLVRQAPALETFVTLCADSLSSPQTYDCSRHPINNYYSPVTRFPRVIEVPVTSRTLLSPRRFSAYDGTTWMASSAPIPFKSYDYDGHMMSAYIAQNTYAAKRNTTLRCWTGMVSEASGCTGPSCINTWQQRTCVGGSDEGKSCTIDDECSGGGSCDVSWSRCRIFFDGDRNKFDRPGNLLKFDFDFAPQISTDVLVNAIPYGARKFTQHAITSVDMPFRDVDNPLGAGGVDTPGDHIKGATWRSGAASVMSITAAYGCDAGTSNQPPRFVGSFGANVVADFNVNTEIRCHYSAPCTYRINATDFIMDAAGRDGATDSTACPIGRSAPCATTDTIVIEPAYGREQFTTSELTEFFTNGPCEGRGRVSCLFSLKTEDVPPENPNVFEQTAIGKIYIQCFVAVDKHAATAAPAAKSCRSLPTCVKIIMEGSKPQFVAPTPLLANSRDDYGRLVPGRTDVPACMGFPLALPIRAQDVDVGDSVRVYIWDPDVDRNLYSSSSQADLGDLAFLPDGGDFNQDFFSSAPVNSPTQCGRFQVHLPKALGPAGHAGHMVNNKALTLVNNKALKGKQQLNPQNPQP